MNAFVEPRGFCVFAVAASLLLFFCGPNAHKESVSVQEVLGSSF
jgi:hypothetical protein